MPEEKSKIVDVIAEAQKNPTDKNKFETVKKFLKENSVKIAVGVATGTLTAATKALLQSAGISI